MEYPPAGGSSGVPCEYPLYTRRGRHWPTRPIRSVSSLSVKSRLGLHRPVPARARRRMEARPASPPSLPSECRRCATAAAVPRRSARCGECCCCCALPPHSMHARADCAESQWRSPLQPWSRPRRTCGGACHIAAAWPQHAYPAAGGRGYRILVFIEGPNSRIEGTDTRIH